MSMLIQVESHPNLLRDKGSKALINTDIAALNEYKNKKKLAEDVRNLSSEVREMKQILFLLIEKIDKYNTNEKR